MSFTKIGKRYSTILFGMFMSLCMSFSMSLVITLINAGLVPDFLQKWLSAFGIGFIVSFPTSLIVIPIIRRLVNRLTTA